MAAIGGGAPSNNNDDEGGDKANDKESAIIRVREVIEYNLKDKLVKYKDEPKIRDIVQKFPEIGMPLDIVLAWIGQKVGEQRLMGYMIDMFDELDQIQENKIDRSFFDSPEFLDIVIRASENSLKTRHRERILLNCKILVGALTIDKIEDRHYAEDFLSFVADLTPTDITVGFEIYKAQRNRPDHFNPESQESDNELQYVVRSGWDTLEDKSPVKGLDRNIAHHKLSAAALIKEVTGVYVGYTGGRYIITPMFQKLMNFIHLRANDPLFSSTIPDPQN
jgi:hypothetical protein